MPNPLTSEERPGEARGATISKSEAMQNTERARLCEYLHDLCDENRWINLEDRCNFRKTADELARTADDARRLDWMQRMHTLHGSVEFLYCVSEYECRVTKDDGNTWQVAVGDSLRDAIDNMMNAALASSKSEAADGGEDGNV